MAAAKSKLPTSYKCIPMKPMNVCRFKMCEVIDIAEGMLHIYFSILHYIKLQLCLKVAKLLTKRKTYR